MKETKKSFPPDICPVQEQPYHIGTTETLFQTDRKVRTGPYSLGKWIVLTQSCQNSFITLIRKTLPSEKQHCEAIPIWNITFLASPFCLLGKISNDKGLIVDFLSMQSGSSNSALQWTHSCMHLHDPVRLQFHFFIVHAQYSVTKRQDAEKKIKTKQASSTKNLMSLHETWIWRTCVIHVTEGRDFTSWNKHTVHFSNHILVAKRLFSGSAHQGEAFVSLPGSRPSHIGLSFGKRKNYWWKNHLDTRSAFCFSEGNRNRGLESPSQKVGLQVETIFSLENNLWTRLTVIEPNKLVLNVFRTILIFDLTQNCVLTLVVFGGKQFFFVNCLHNVHDKMIPQKILRKRANTDKQTYIVT